jgi:hypothetical protein
VSDVIDVAGCDVNPSHLSVHRNAFVITTRLVETLSQFCTRRIGNASLKFISHARTLHVVDLVLWFLSGQSLLKIHFVQFMLGIPFPDMFVILSLQFGSTIRFSICVLMISPVRLTKWM